MVEEGAVDVQSLRSLAAAISSTVSIRRLCASSGLFKTILDLLLNSLLSSLPRFLAPLASFPVCQLSVIAEFGVFCLWTAAMRGHIEALRDGATSLICTENLPQNSPTLSLVTSCISAHDNLFDGFPFSALFHPRIQLAKQLLGRCVVAASVSLKFASCSRSNTSACLFHWGRLRAIIPCYRLRGFTTWDHQQSRRGFMQSDHWQLAVQTSSLIEVSFRGFRSILSVDFLLVADDIGLDGIAALAEVLMTNSGLKNLSLRGECAFDEFGVTRERALSFEECASASLFEYGAVSPFEGEDYSQSLLPMNAAKSDCATSRSASVTSPVLRAWSPGKAKR
eukprot:2337619-Pleurochrysis_carterae.AAC.2